MSVLDDDVERASGLVGTEEGCYMLHLEKKPSHNYAGNTYLTALREIVSLRARIAALEAAGEGMAKRLEIFKAAIATDTEHYGRTKAHVTDWWEPEDAAALAAWKQAKG